MGVIKDCLLAVPELAFRPEFQAYVDFVVLGNIVLVGYEVDHGSQGLDVLRLFIALSYSIEMPLRMVSLFSWRRLLQCACVLTYTGLFGIPGFTFWRWLLKHMMDFWLDLVILILMLVDIFQGQYTWFWRLSLLRIFRFLRIYKIAERSPSLAELWVVMAGIARARRALGWLALLLIIILYASAATATGLVEANVRPYPTCDGQDLRMCFNAHEYFGSVPQSMLTMLQIATLDAWASHIVRPLMLSKPFAAVVLVVFACATAYGVLSVAVGVLVYSTVELARHRGDHTQLKQSREDAEIISQLGDYFAAVLMVEERYKLQFIDIEEALLIPQIAAALRDLQLPVKGTRELFEHLDKRRVGEISVLELRHGLALMKNPATRFDIACLSATIGGSCTFTARIEQKAIAAYDELCDLSTTLETAFSELELLHLPGGKMSEMPELVLRKNGRIADGDPLSTPRYS
mmetsp:Transcript_21743/g.61693  ORF Transcript_21743/g.61693 Transcript_21743/m.61693 type:complete len:461 (-) Transcript_21743:151-1533(-)